MKKLVLFAAVAGLVLCFGASLHAGNFPNPGAAPVIVTNPVSKPVPVTIDNTEPIRLLLQVILPDTDWSTPKAGIQFYTVPAGKRLVIEYVSYQAENVDGNAGQTVLLSVFSADSILYLPMSQPMVPFSATPIVQGGQEVRHYMNPGQDVNVSLARGVTATGRLSVFVNITGYLIGTP
jgi:hypothetical protein